MEQSPYGRDVIDPEIQAYVSNLVTALGGTGTDEHGLYVLGDDALACLRDLRRWLNLYDQRLNRLDVARCLAAANLVNGDLLPILSLWPENATDDKVKYRIALACFELLVPLTWPYEKADSQMTVNHHRHLPYLQAAQVAYKRGILNCRTAKILRTAVRIILPCMAIPVEERSNRDESIIRLILYFIRNIAMISKGGNTAPEDDDNEVSRSATIDAFYNQDVFHLLLTMASGMDEDFKAHDVVVLEVLFHLLKGIDAERLFLTESELETRKTDELQRLLDKEAGMLRSYARYAPTRHNRFGTTIWLKRDDGRVSTISGQDALRSDERCLAKMDETKKWNKPRTGKRADPAESSDDTPITLTSDARRHLRGFVGDFLDSGFNPLFHHVHRAIEHEADRVLDTHPRQFFFLISWFLKAHRTRRRAARSTQMELSGTYDEEANSFALIAGVLTQEVFITLNRFMQKSYDTKEWEDLKAGMRCFTQILLTVQEMSDSPLEDDQQIAENIQNRLFYEEATHDRIVSIIRYYSHQGFGYLDACTELAHVHIRMLEHYSKQNIELHVRSRRKTRKKKQAAQKPSQDVDATADDQDHGNEEGSGDEEIKNAQQTSTERKFDFKRFCLKFMTQACVNTFVKLAEYYRDLNSTQLKRAHRFFYRVAFKNEMSVMLFRVDIIALLNKMIKGPEGLDSQSPEYKEWAELVQQLFKKLTRKIQERPQLLVEMLFSKTNAIAYHLEHGHDKQLISAHPRPAVELEIKPDVEPGRRIAIAVSALISQGKQESVQWVKTVLEHAIDERGAWEGQAALRLSNEPEAEQHSEVEAYAHAPVIAVRPDKEERRIALTKDAKLRLLLTVIGFQQTGSQNGADAWIVPSSLPSSELLQNLESIKTAESNPPIFDEGQTAEDFIRKKSAATRKRRVDFDDDSEGDDFINNEEDYLFPAGGPTVRKSDALEELKQKKTRKRKERGPLDDKELEAAAKARAEANARKRQKIKSDLFVHDSDEEEDEERDRDFFAKEEVRREAQNRKVLEALQQERLRLEAKDAKGGSSKATAKVASRKRKSDAGDQTRQKRRRSIEVPSGDEDETDDVVISSGGFSAAENQLLEEDSDVETDTPPTSPQLHSPQEKLSGRQMSLPARSKRATPLTSKAPGLSSDIHSVGEDDEDGDTPISRLGGRATRGGFVIESDSE